jgi:hypothetical protein
MHLWSVWSHRTYTEMIKAQRIVPLSRHGRSDTGVLELLEVLHA